MPVTKWWPLRQLHGWYIAGFLGVGLSCPCLAQTTMEQAINDAMPTVDRAYRFLHENPELGKQEFKAQAYLREELGKFGTMQMVASDLAPTAVIAILDSGTPGPVIALRAEMDGRKLEKGLVEPISHQPRSKIDGLMHNCGHDAHAAMLLGSAALLSNNRDKFRGKVIFLFQPAEETAGGADDIVREGILQNLGVQSIFAQHVAPGLELGKVAAGPGFVLAGSSTFSLSIRGAGSHAASPEHGTDTPLVAARMALALGTFPARHLELANKPVVISVTRIHSDGNASNAIPANAEMSGTIRAFEDIFTPSESEPSLHDRLKSLAERHAALENVDITWTVKPGAPSTLNDPQLFADTGQKIAEAWGRGFDRSPSRGMYAEDFAYYTAKMPALYFALGIAKDGQGMAGVHTAEFSVPLEAFGSGLRLLTLTALVATKGDIAW